MTGVGASPFAGVDQGARDVTVRRTRLRHVWPPEGTFPQVRALHGGRFDHGEDARVTWFLSARRRTERAPRGAVTRPADLPSGLAGNLGSRGAQVGKHKPLNAAHRPRDGVRVSFENSTVCRACLFGTGGVVPVLMLALMFAGPVPLVEGFWLGPVFVGEFDPGSGRTLAACLTHASRAVRPFGVHERRTGE